MNSANTDKREILGSTPEELKRISELYPFMDCYPPTYHGQDGEVYNDLDVGDLYQYFSGEWYRIGTFRNVDDKLDWNKVDQRRIKDCIYQDLREPKSRGELDAQTNQ